MIKADLCVIGASIGGITIASRMAELGLRIILVATPKERPEKTLQTQGLLLIAHMVETMRQSPLFGLPALDIDPEIEKINPIFSKLRKKTALHNPVRHLKQCGIDVIEAADPHFLSPQSLKAGHKILYAKHFVIATASTVFIPEIIGLSQVAYFTPDTILDYKTFIPHLAILGEDITSLEMAQAYRRLGSKVTLITPHHILREIDSDVVHVLRETLIKEGVVFKEAAHVVQIKNNKHHVDVMIQYNGLPQRILASKILISSGREPAFAHMALENASIVSTPCGLYVDESFRTTNPRIYAIGDSVGPPYGQQFETYHAGVVMRDFFTPFSLPHSNTQAIPFIVFTDPEIAHVGFTEQDVQEEKTTHKVLFWSFEQNDRAQLSKATRGFIKVLIKPNGKILGCTIIGKNASELIQPWCLAVMKNLKIKDIAMLVTHPGTLSEINKHVANQFYVGTFLSGITKFWVRCVMNLRFLII